MGRNRIDFVYNEESDTVAMKIPEIIKFIKNFSKFSIKDYEKQRAVRINEILDCDDDVDIRFEKEFTEINVKNMKVLTNHLVKEFERLEKEFRNIVDGQK